MKKIDLLIKKGLDFLKNSATVLLEIPKKTNKNIFLAFVLLIAFNTFAYSQCVYPTNAPQIGPDYTFCIDGAATTNPSYSNSTFTIPIVNAGQYVVVNVVQGFNYTFSVGNVFTTTNIRENITLFNFSNVSVGHLSGDTGVILNWTASLTGKIKVLLSAGSGSTCINNNTNGGAVTVRLNTIGNTLDNETIAGTDKWIGHVYNLSSGTGIPPGGNSPETPTASDPFVNSNYVGYYSTANEEINEGFGGDNACFLVTSAATTIYTEKFAVRYRMNSKRPAGYYFINVTGDDGVRVYVDGVLVVNEWKEQGATSYCDNLIYLNGNSNLILDYYENGGQNVVKFTLKPFVENNNPNIITGSTSYNLCSGSSPGTLSANPYTASCGPSRPNVTYQWQISSDNVLWTDINSAGNLQNYDVPALSPLTNTVRYYRRLVKSRGSNDATGGVVSNIITVNTSAATVGGAVNGGTTICSGVSSGVLTLSGQTGNVVRWESAPNASGPWSPIVNTNSTYTSGPLTQTTLFRAVVQNGACAVATSSSTTVTVNPAPLLTTQPTALTICENTSGSFSVVTSATNPTYQWQYSKDNTNWTNISATFGPNATNYTTATVTFSNTPFAYNGYYVRCLVSASTGCTTISNAVLLTVNPKLSAPTIGTVTQPTCSTATGSTVLNGLPAGPWLLTRNPGNVSLAGTGTSATITGLVAGTSYTFSVNSFTNGLKGEYFKNTTLGGPPTLTRTDPTINFDWGNGSPDTVIPVDGFSARWSGLVQPIYSENYTFSTLSDDGIRLWVNGVKLIDNWNDHSPVTNTGSILLTAGVKYDIILEYYENAGGAVSKLSWSSTSQSLQIIPTAQLFTVSGCDSPPSANVVINPQPATPGAPTGTITQSFCSGSSPKVTNLQATGTGIKWYVAATGGTALDPNTALVNNTHYFASQTVDGCESTARFEVTANILFSLTKVLASDACNSTKKSTVTVTAVPASLPIGNYQVSYKINNSNPELTATMNVTTAGTGVFIADVSVIGYEATGTLTITKITNGTCASVMSIQSNDLRVVGVTKPAVQQGYYQCDRKWVAQWTPVNYANGYIIDVSIFSDFSTILKTYTVIGQSVIMQIIDNLAFGGIYYYRVRATSALCEPSPYSDPIAFTIVGNNSSNPGTISGVDMLCLNASSQFSVSGNPSANGTWSVFNQTGTASVTTNGLVTGLAPGKVKVVFTTRNTDGSCGTSTTKDLTITVAGTVSAASSSPIVCANSLIANITHTTTVYTGIGSPTGLPAGVNAVFASNTITISGTPTAPGTFNYSIPLTGGCAGAAATGTITVNKQTAITTQPQALVSYCQDSVASSLAVSATGTGTLSCQWYSNTVNSNTGGTPVNSANAASYTPSTSDVGTVYYYAVVNGFCGSETSIVSAITVTPSNTVELSSLSGTNAQQICAASAIRPIRYQTTGATGIENSGISTGVNGLPAGVTATWANNTIIISGTPTVEGVFNYNIPLTGGCGNRSATGTIKVGETSTFKDGGWDKGRPDNNGLNAHFLTDYNTNQGSVYACNCMITAGKKVTIEPYTSLTVVNSFINNGSMTVRSDGNFVQIKNTPIPVNSGKIVSEREFKIGADRVQYNYLGSPVAFETGQSFKTIFPGSTNTSVLYHNQTTNTFSTSSGANVPGRGSAVKEPPISTVLTEGKSTAQFKGTPQNGEIILAIANKDVSVNTFGYNLLGNPYASNIDLRKLYDLNGGKTDSLQIISPNISPTFYFWDNNHNKIFQQQGSNYGGQSYALFNVLTGRNGTGTEAGSLNGESIVGTKKPTKIVKVGQGFMTKSLVSSYSFKFDNSIRTTEGSNVDFLGKGSPTVQDDRYWLRMTAPSGITSTIAIVHYPGGNDGFGAEDSRTMGGSDAVFSIVDGEKAAINGRSAFRDTDKIALGTSHFTTGNYKVEIDTAEGMFSSGQAVYLKDKVAGIITNLSQGSYTFAATAGESTGRFEIIYQPETVLATEGVKKENLLVYRDGSNFVVKSSTKKITSIQVLDTSGRLILSLQPNEIMARIKADSLSNGIYILRIEQGNQVSAKKIIK